MTEIVEWEKKSDMPLNFYIVDFGDFLEKKCHLARVKLS